ncbi:MAG: AAA family ATPase [Elainellaceae cyanobacterium]
MIVDDPNAAALYELADALDLGLGKFSLHLVRCRYRALRSHLADQLQQICRDEFDLEIERVTLEPSAQNLYTSIQKALGAEREMLGDLHQPHQPQALMVLGLEQVTDLDQVLGATENVREEFRKHFQFPLVLWLDSDTSIQFTRQAPNFASWSPDLTDLAIASDALQNALHRGAEAIYTTLLKPEDSTLPSLLANMPTVGDFEAKELGLAVQELTERGLSVEPEQQAALNLAIAFHRANQNHEDLETPKALLQQSVQKQSVQIWDGRPQQSDEGINTGLKDGLKAGLVLFFLGRHLSWMADRQRRQGLEVVPEHWVDARDVLEQAIQHFRQGDRPDLVAKCLSVFQRVLTRVEDWDALEHYAHLGLELHQTYIYPRKLAYDYGFLSRVALERQQWHQTQTYATEAIAQVKAATEAEPWIHGLYLLHLAKAERALGKPEMAIAHLQEAQNYGDRFHPTTYCDILATLRQLRLEQKRYLDAFKLKQERLEVEKDAGIRAFVGAGRLGMAAQSLEGLEDVAPEIEASGRKQDLDQLRERIGRSDYKLIVIHGSSGVGKSSLVNAGLVPLLRKQRIGIQDNLVVLVRTYSTDWLADLAERFSQELQKLRRGSMAAMTLAPSPGSFSQEENPSSPGPFSQSGRREDEAELLRELALSEARVVRTVLIFDQFEEFFFANPDRLQWRQFFEFVGRCLAIPYVKVVLSLREDYIHYLLEANRLDSMSAVGHDILGRNVLYALGNLSLPHATAAIHDLTARSRFRLQSELIDQLVKDLGGELEEVRPIEMQIVGAQLQTMGITTLNAYQELGESPKEELVKGYLQEVVNDCGPDHHQLAELVLYLLTDERGTRPLKTRSGLEQELESLLPDEEALAPLELVLRVLCGAGVVVYLPEEPEDRYQLVHDYIAEFIRQQQGNKLVAELSEERQKREQAENLQRLTAEELTKARQVNSQAKRRLAVGTGVLLVSLMAAAVAVPMAIVAGNQASEAARREEQANEQFGEAQTELAQAESEKASADADVVAAREEVEQAKVELDELTEKNNASEAEIEAAEQRLAEAQQQFESAQQAQEEAQVALEDTRNLQQQAERERESAQTERAAAQEESQLARTGTRLERAGVAAIQRFEFQQTEGLLAALRAAFELQDMTQGKQIQTLENYPAASPLLATQTSLDKQQETRFEGHQGGVLQVSFSPDGTRVATRGEDGTARLWDLAGNELARFEGHQGRVSQVSFSPDGTRVATSSYDGTARLWALDGTELARFEGHQGGVSQVSFSPDGTRLATSSYDGTARLWALDGTELARFEGHQGRVSQVSFSPDGTRLATSSDDGTARLWALDGTELARFEGHQGGVYQMSFSPDGTRLATRGEDGTARLWALDGTELARFEGHQDSVYQMSFSPDGTRVATSSYDGTARLWDLAGNELARFEGHQGWVSQVSFSPDGTRLATSSYDGTIRIWLIPGSDPDPKRVIRGQQIAQYEGRLGTFSPDWRYVYIIQPGNALIDDDPDNERVTKWRVDDLDGLVARACDRLRGYLTHSPNVTNEDRAMCGIPPR